MPSRGNMNHVQDWEPQVVRPTGANRVHVSHDEKDINKARQLGAEVEVHQKKSLGPNKNHAQEASHVYKIANDTENYSHKTIDHSVATNIRKARTMKEMTQTELAHAISERVQVLQSYEKGTAIPDAQVLKKIERALGMPVRGVNALKPFPKRG